VPDLTQARLKVARAKHHLDAFQAARQSFLQRQPFVTLAEFDESENTTYFRLGPLPEIPAELSLIAGDAAHALRTSLDYLACELVRDESNNPKNVYFPICETATKYATDSPSKTKGMSTTAKATIDRLKPYGGGTEYLWALHYLDITDKHRLLVTVGARVGIIHVSPGRTPTPVGFLTDSPVLQEGDILGHLAGNHVGTSNMTFELDIALGEPDAFEGQPVLDVFRNMVTIVEAILAHFAGERPLFS